MICSVAFADNPYRSFNNLNAGELTPLLDAREDLAKYQNGCSIMENMIPIPQGGAQKRPGTKFIAEVKTSSLATRILPFEFSTSQSYVIEAGNQYFRFFTNGAPVFATFGTEDLSAFDSATGDSSLVAHWKCDESSGAGAGAVTDDTVAGTHDGTPTRDISNFTTTDVAGTANAAFDLAGVDYFTVPDHADLSFGNGSNDEPFTMAIWCNVVADTVFQEFLFKENEWDFGMNDDETVTLRLEDDSAGSKKISVTTTAPLSNGWHFIVATYSAPPHVTQPLGISGDNLGIRIYVDWGEVATTVSESQAGYVAMEDLIGDVDVGNAFTGSFIWQSKIDNVAIFNKELSAVEVASLTGIASTTPAEIVTPYLTADLFELQASQSADVLYITHPDYETRKLSRLSNSIWSLNASSIESGPFRTQNSDTNFKMAASATTGSVTLTATGGAPFISGTTGGHLPSGDALTDKSNTGALFKIVHPIDTLEFKEELESDFAAGQVENTSWVDCGILYKGAGWTLVTGDTWFGTIKVQRNYTIGAAVGNGGDEGASLGWETVFAFSSGAGAAVSARNVSTTGTEDDGDAQYRVIYADETADDTVSVYFTTDQTEHVGIVKITAVASTTSATGTVVTTLASTDATYKWAEGSWSNYRGWPATSTFFEDRLMFGGNAFQPDTIWGSVTSDYDNMTAGVNDDEAVIFTLSSRQVNVIEWLIGKDKLLIGTSGAEWTIAGGTDEPLTPTNVIAKNHSTYGSANLQATLANESVLFFQRGKRKMRELAYNWELDSYVAPDMTILANLVTDTGINDTAFQKTPDSILWTVRADGELPVFSYERDENVTAWSRMITEDSTSDSDFESVAKISGDPEDEIWVVVERTIDSNTVRYIEQFQPRIFSDPCDAYYVDAGITYDSTATTTITGLTHLVGETVAVLGDGVALGDEVVDANGEITIDASASTVQVGLPYEVHLRTMPLSWLGGVTIQGKQKKISEVVSRWYKSGDFSIGKDVDNQQTYSISGQTTDIDRKTFSPGYSRNGYIYIYQKSPEPLTILSVMAEFQVQ